MEAAYVRGRLSADEFLKQCAIVNPHLQLHYRLALMKKEEPAKADEQKPRKITGPSSKRCARLTSAL